MQNLTASITYHAARHPQATAVIFDAQKISYADFLDRIERLGDWLQDAGVKADGVVALVMKNSPAFLEIAFAVSHLGGIFLPVNYRLSSAEVSYIAQKPAPNCCSSTPNWSIWQPISLQEWSP